MSSVNYHHRVNDLKKFLVNWGYKEDEIKNEIDRATNVERNHLLTVLRRIEASLEKRLGV